MTAATSWTRSGQIMLWFSMRGLLGAIRSTVHAACAQASSIIKCTTEGLFVTTQSPPVAPESPWWSFLSEQTLGAIVKDRILTTCTFSWPPYQVVSSPEFPALTGGGCYNDHVGQFYMEPFSSLQAVKSPITPNPCSNALNPLQESGSEDRKSKRL